MTVYEFSSNLPRHFLFFPIAFALIDTFSGCESVSESVCDEYNFSLERVGFE